MLLNMFLKRLSFGSKECTEELCNFSGPDYLVSALAPKLKKKKKNSELLSARPAYIANEICGPQSGRSNRSDL